MGRGDTVPLFLFLGDQRITTVDILLDKWILDLRNPLFSFPFVIHGDLWGMGWMYRGEREREREDVEENVGEFRDKRR